MEVRKIKADDRFYDVISLEDYDKKIPNEVVAVEWKGHVYPERNKDDTRPGLYKASWGTYLKEPETDEEKSMYSANNILDLNSSKDIKELIQKSSLLRNMEREILTSPNNIFIPPLLDNDDPEMRGLKNAVISKNIDIDKYEDRFGSNFNNDKRLFFKPNITMSKLKSIANNLDMRVTLTISDRNPDVPNPIGKEIIMELVGDNYNE